jgi:hypothetical protein
MVYLSHKIEAGVVLLPLLATSCEIRPAIKRENLRSLLGLQQIRPKGDIAGGDKPDMVDALSSRRLRSSSP